jgi:hypothetical protein
MAKPIIAILTPMTSKAQKWTEFHECAFITTLLPSLLRTCEFNKYEYRFYLGLDHDDAFFNKHMVSLKKRLHPKDRVLSLKGYKGNPCGIWTELMRVAHADGCDYFAQLGDDIRIESDMWSSYFIGILKRSNDIGVAGGVDEPFWISRLANREIGILENAFVSRHHFNTFGFFFPPELKGWWSDDWISAVYGSRCYTCPAIHFSNTNRVGDHNELSRYKPNMKDEGKWLKIAERDAKVLKRKVL